MAALILVIFLSAFCGISTAKIQVSPNKNSFIDEQGHTRIFHGISQVNKDADVDNGLLYYTQTQLQQLKSYGFTAIRLGFLWNAYETAPGLFNEEYMNGIENLTNYFAEYGMMTILDMHQDLWSPLFCGGHGIPEFYSYPDNETDAYWKHQNKSYPLPHFKAHGYNNDTEYSNVFGNVDAETCHEMVDNTSVGWAASYTTYSLSNAVQRFYDNHNNYLANFAYNFWYRVAKRFANNSGVLGYELINEPWVGDVFTYPELYTPKACDIVNLKKVYYRLNDVIREMDNDTIIFYEPCTGGNDLDAFPCGFDEGPGGKDYDSKQSLSYHIYCPLIQTDVPLNSSMGNDTLEACYELNDLQWQYRLNDTKRLDTAGFLTEFGAIPQTDLGYELIDYMMNTCDDHLVSWTYWYLVPSNDVSKPSLVAPYISRTYAYQIASNNITKMQFDSSDKSFVLEYEMFMDQVERKLVTKIYYSKQFHYPNGVQYSVEPENYVNVKVNNNDNEIVLNAIKNPQNGFETLKFQMLPL